MTLTGKRFQPISKTFFVGTETNSSKEGLIRKNHPSIPFKLLIINTLKLWRTQHSSLIFKFLNCAQDVLLLWQYLFHESRWLRQRTTQYTLRSLNIFEHFIAYIRSLTDCQCNLNDADAGTLSLINFWVQYHALQSTAQKYIKLCSWKLFQFER